MLYAIKVDNAIVYIGQIKDASDEAWQQEYEKHKGKIYAQDHNDLEEHEQNFYFMLYYWKTSEYKEIQMKHILPDTAEEDEEQIMNMLIGAIEPIGNMKKYWISGREAWW